MTLIECFTNAHVDNIAACLRLRPDKMVMVGNAAEMGDSIKRYKKLLKQRGMGTEITVCDVQRMDLGDIYAALKKVVPEGKDCVIDLTGGDECAIMAVGAVLVELPVEARKRIRVEKYDHKAGIVRDCVNDNRKIQAKAVKLTAEELIALHGGIIHPDAYQPPANSSSRDLDRLWQMVSEAPKDWNLAIRKLGEFESRSDSKIRVFLPLEQLRGSISDFETKEEIVRDLLGKLHHLGIIEDRSSCHTLEYAYRSQMLRYCTQKAGNVLEMKTLLEGRAVLENGAPYFNDCQMSVTIDWDGVVNDPMDHTPETRNEIDVVLMHGTTPLFISCKNGNIDEAEPYKLHTVAERFGGPYAKKMLIVTDPAAISPALDQRAQDMHITLVTNIANLSKDEWHHVFKKAMQ